MLSEVARHKRTKLSFSTYMRYLEQADSETESGREVSRGWGEGVRMNSCLMGTNFVRDDAMGLGRDSGDNYIHCECI